MQYRVDLVKPDAMKFDDKAMLDYVSIKEGRVLYKSEVELE